MKFYACVFSIEWQNTLLILLSRVLDFHHCNLGFLFVQLLDKMPIDFGVYPRSHWFQPLQILMEIFTAIRFYVFTLRCKSVGVLASMPINFGLNPYRYWF